MFAQIPSKLSIQNKPIQISQVRRRAECLLEAREIGELDLAVGVVCLPVGGHLPEGRHGEGHHAQPERHLRELEARHDPPFLLACLLLMLSFSQPECVAWSERKKTRTLLLSEH